MNGPLARKGNFYPSTLNHYSLYNIEYLNSDGILDVDLHLAGIDSGRIDVIAGFERQLVASKLSIETGSSWGCPNQTQSGAARTQTFTNKLRTTTWTCEKVR